MLIKLLLLQVIQHCDSIILVSKEIQFPSVSHSSSSGDGGTHPAVSHKDNLSVGSWKNSEEEVLYCSRGLDLIKGRSHPSIISFHDQECSPQLFDREECASRVDLWQTISDRHFEVLNPTQHLGPKLRSQQQFLVRFRASASSKAYTRRVKNTKTAVNSLSFKWRYHL